MKLDFRTSLLVVTCLGLLAFAPEGLAQQTEHTGSSMIEAAWDWRPGDLIFRNGLNGFDDAVQTVEGAQWASVGILRASSGRPRVVFVDEHAGVTEVMLDTFIEDITADGYAVHRVRDVQTELPDGQQIQGPMATYSLFVAYGAPYDALLRFGNGIYYNAELAFEAALNAGVVLGQPAPINSIAMPGNVVWETVMQGWQDNPYCVAAQTIEECWVFISDASIVTTGVLLASPYLDQVYPQ